MSICILVAEDEQEIADFVVRDLREEGFSVDLAMDGIQAFRALETNRWDVVLLSRIHLTGIGSGAGRQTIGCRKPPIRAREASSRCTYRVRPFQE